MKRKHDRTDEAIRLIVRATEWEDQVGAFLRSYKQDDLLADICSAREAAANFRLLANELAEQVATIAESEVASRTLRRQR